MKDRNSINGYYLLEQDLKEIFSFVEPSKENFSTYSHRLYSLFIRACIEFEASCKAILVEQKPDLVTNNLNITNYCEIHNYDPYKSVDSYEVKLHLSQAIDIIPLENWKNSRSLKWYQDYNTVKHSRINEFKKATLGNALNAVAAVYILLCAKHGIEAVCQYQETTMTHCDGNYIWGENSLFKIKMPGKVY